MDWFKRELDCELCGKSTNKKEMNSIYGKKYCDECGSVLQEMVNGHFCFLREISPLNAEVYRYVISQKKPKLQVTEKIDQKDKTGKFIGIADDKFVVNYRRQLKFYNSPAETRNNDSLIFQDKHINDILSGNLVEEKKNFAYYLQQIKDSLNGKKIAIAVSCLLLIIAVFVIGGTTKNTNVQSLGQDYSESVSSFEYDDNTTESAIERSEASNTSITTESLTSKETSDNSSTTSSNSVIGIPVISTTKAITTKAPVKYGGMEITMLDVGQGLSILVKADNEYMIVDGGGRSRSSYVVAYLKSHNITNLKYMFVSHYDEDHIAGLIGVLNTTQVGTVVCPGYTDDTKIYSSFITKLSENGAKVIHPKVDSTYNVGKATITVLGPVKSFDDDNNRSLILRIAYGTFSSIITGDAETDSEYATIQANKNLNCDLYIVGHHGSSSSSSASFVKAMTPAYAFISVGKGNSYGHPSSKTLTVLKNNNVKIFRSDIQGEVTCYCDGKSYHFSEEPSNNWNSGATTTTTKKATTTKKQTTVPDRGSPNNSNKQTYILNVNTHKFHYPSCKSVKQMNEENKREVYDSRDNIIAQGYDPCGNCHP